MYMNIYIYEHIIYSYIYMYICIYIHIYISISPDMNSVRVVSSGHKITSKQSIHFTSFTDLFLTYFVSNL